MDRLKQRDVTHSRTYAMRLFGLGYPLAAGLLLYGWRAAGVIITLIAAAALAYFIWRHISPFGWQLSLRRTLASALILSMMLPAHLFQIGLSETSISLWPLIPAAALLLVMLIWFLCGIGLSRIYPLLLTLLLTTACFAPALMPHYVLYPNRLLGGDLLDTRAPVQVHTRTGWSTLRSDSHYDAIWREPASHYLLQYSSGRIALSNQTIPTLNGLLRGQMPPLEDLIIAGQPAPIGCASAIAIIVGGLFLLYRGLIDYRVPLLICLAAMVSFLILPIPLGSARTHPWQGLIFQGQQLGWSTVLTFANYQLMAGPLLFMAIFLATDHSINPASRSARTIWSICVGFLTAFMQLYASISTGPYIALLVMGLITTLLNRRIRPNTSPIHPAS